VIKNVVKKVLNLTGFKLTRISEDLNETLGLSEIESKEFGEIYERCRPYTITSAERMYALYLSLKYVVQHGIKGDVVECGVFKGGSSMLAALVLMKTGAIDRKIYLYDTYSGMTKPTEKDVDLTGRPALKTWLDMRKDEHINMWTYCPLEEVKRNLFSTGYPKENLIFVKGRCEDTIPGIAPEKISVLRLDTDWHDSTYHELRHLFPRLAARGVLIIDDYGHHRGAREAVDEYFRGQNEPILLSRIDYTGRLGIKTG
jgi:hypothetical protein